MNKRIKLQNQLKNISIKDMVKCTYSKKCGSIYHIWETTDFYRCKIKSKYITNNKAVVK